MTLFRQIMIAVLVLFVVFYTGSTIVSLNNNRTLVEEQMRIHAQDTATSLALSMTQLAADQDTASLETLFNAVSDSGFFQRVYFESMDGEIVIDRRFPVSVEGVPDWFIERASLPLYQGKADVIAGWSPIGKLTVVSHPGNAYQKLWQTSKSQLFWFVVITFLACILVGVALRVILNPLVRVEHQANAISEGDFQIQLTIPSSRELKSVVEAMNRMASKLKQLFSDQVALITRLREQSYTDAVTGLSNRADFDARITSYVGVENGGHSAVLAIISVAGLSDINRLGGRLEGNNVLRSIAGSISEAVQDHPKAVIARRQGTEFALFVPDLDKDEGSYLAAKVFQSVELITWGEPSSQLPGYAMGFIYTDELEDVVELFSSADIALKKAQQAGLARVQDFSQLDAAEAPVLSKPIQEWQQFVNTAIDNGQIELHYQPVFQVEDKKLLSNEVYVRFPGNGDLLSAGTVVPVVERLGLMPELDKVILEKTASEYVEKGIATEYRVNLSAHSISKDGFSDWLDGFLSSHKLFAKSLIIEVAEYAVHGNKESVEKINAVLNKYQAQMCIDHFGLESSSFSYLAGLRLHSLKVHRSFVTELPGNTDNRFYIKALANLAHNLDIKLYVEGIESEAAYLLLGELDVDGCQGFYLGEPAKDPVDQS